MRVLEIGMYNGACYDGERFITEHDWYVESSEIDFDGTNWVHAEVILCCSNCNKRIETDYSWSVE